MSKSDLEPEGLHELLQGFVICIIKNQPEDLIEFSAQYFADLLEQQRKNMGVTSLGTSLQINQPRAVREVRMDSSEDILNCEEEETMERRSKSLKRRISVFGESFDPSFEDDNEEVQAKTVYPKSDAERNRLEKVVQKMVMFQSLDMEQTQQVLDAMFERFVIPGEHVIDQGEAGDNFYIIERGSYDIFMMDDQGVQQYSGSYNNQGSFGELALMYNTPRAATIIATTSGALWAMDRQTFHRIVVKDTFRKRTQYEDFLESVPLLSTLTKEERMKVADSMITRHYEDGDVIIKQGEDADYFYMVISGVVKIIRTGDDPNNPSKEVELTRYCTGNYFGELALIQNQKRAASAIADGSVKCAALDVQAFERLLGPCKDLLSRNIPLYEQQLADIYKNIHID